MSSGGHRELLGAVGAVGAAEVKALLDGAAAIKGDCQPAYGALVRLPEL